MNQALKVFVKKMLSQFDIAIVKSSDYQRLIEFQNDVEFLLKQPEHHLVQLSKFSGKSKSQSKQDLFVLSELDFKRNGFFVDFGATDGITSSNSYLLEKELGWDGILAEPAKCWHNDLRNNRNCHIETNCVWRESNSSLLFNEVDYPELSTINTYSSADHHYRARDKGKTYTVNTISLIELLEKYNAPKLIDYLSIDTEGTEFEILRNFDFDKYHFKTITCEHNFTAMREKIFQLLTSKGYARKFIGLSKFDDWYVKAE